MDCSSEGLRAPQYFPSEASKSTRIPTLTGGSKVGTLSWVANLIKTKESL